MEAPDSATSRPLTLDERLRGDVIRGLLSNPKTLPARLFYDERGAALFEQISALPEYYLTRSETEILNSHRDAIAALAGSQTALIEYGSGAGEKTGILLKALKPVAYIPVDIATLQLSQVAARLALDHPGLHVFPLNVDYTASAPVRVPVFATAARKVGFFSGSTIGNFHPSHAATFLREIRKTLGPGGSLILGVDRRKDPTILTAAYNDSAGVTARFNLNALERLNRELDADFDLGKFAHYAFFNEDASRMEMHLLSRESQMVHVGGNPIHFEPGETIRTEYSYKYDEPGLERLASAGGFVIRDKWTDSEQRFWVAFLEEKRGSPR